MNDEIEPGEQCFNAYLIPKVNVILHEGKHFVRCPFCESLNRMTDTYRGLHICGDCHVPFNVI